MIAGDSFFFVLRLFFFQSARRVVKKGNTLILSLLFFSFFALILERKVYSFRTIRFGRKIYLPSSGDKTWCTNANATKKKQRNMAWEALIWIICKLEDKWYVVINEIARPINGVVNNSRSSCVADGAGVRMRCLETAWRLRRKRG